MSRNHGGVCAWYIALLTMKYWNGSRNLEIHRHLIAIARHGRLSNRDALEDRSPGFYGREMALHQYGRTLRLLSLRRFSPIGGRGVCLSRALDFDRWRKDHAYGWSWLSNSAFSLPSSLPHSRYFNCPDCTWVGNVNWSRRLRRTGLKLFNADPETFDCIIAS